MKFSQAITMRAFFNIWALECICFSLRLHAKLKCQLTVPAVFFILFLALITNFANILSDSSEYLDTASGEEWLVENQALFDMSMYQGKLQYFSVLRN